MGFELIETRYVSGKGIIQLPFDKVANRALKLYIDVIRRPINRYLNYQWNPPKSFYANLTFCRGDYVYQEKALHYESECIDLIPDISGQNLFALKCATRDILKGIANLGNAFGVSAVDNLEVLTEFRSLSIDWDIVRVQCYADSAIALRLYRLKYVVCEDADDNEEPSGEPPPPLPKVPPGTPLSDENYPVSPPYTEGDTVPYPDDELKKPALPAGEACEKIQVIWSNTVYYADSGATSVFDNNGVVCFAPVEEMRISADGVVIEILCRGALASPGVTNPVDTCQEESMWYQCNETPFGIFTEIKITSVAPVP